MMAEKEAEAKKIAADAEKVRATVEAEAQRLLNEAENVLTDDARYSLFRRKLLEHVEGIIAASVKPMEKIGDIKIMQLDGINGGGGGDGRKNPTDEVIDSALRYRVQAPMVDSLMSDLGIDGGNLSKMGGLIREARDIQSIAKGTHSRATATGGSPDAGSPGDGGPDTVGGPDDGGTPDGGSGPDSGGSGGGTRSKSGGSTRRRSSRSKK